MRLSRGGDPIPVTTMTVTITAIRYIRKRPQEISLLPVGERGQRAGNSSMPILTLGSDTWTLPYMPSGAAQNKSGDYA